MLITANPHSQSGAALVVSLLILLVMTLLGVSSMQTTTMEEKMSSNLREHAQAFEAAEAALRTGEQYIEDNVSLTAAFDTDGSDGLYDDENIQERWRSLIWDGTDSIEHTGHNGTYSSAPNPRFVIENYGSAQTDVDRYNLSGYGSGAGGGDITLFRITARGTGANNSSPVYLQSYFGKVL